MPNATNLRIVASIRVAEISATIASMVGLGTARGGGNRRSGRERAPTRMQCGFMSRSS